MLIKETCVGRLKSLWDRSLAGAQVTVDLGERFSGFWDGVAMLYGFEDVQMNILPCFC